MVIGDLKQTCAACRGSGRMAGITSLGISQINAGGLCPTCGGRGFRLTELGQDVLKVLRPFVQEMIDAAAPPPPKQGKEDAEAE